MSTGIMSSKERKQKVVSGTRKRRVHSTVSNKTGIVPSMKLKIAVDISGTKYNASFSLSNETDKPKRKKNKTKNGNSLNGKFNNKLRYVCKKCCCHFRRIRTDYHRNCLPRSVTSTAVSAACLNRPDVKDACSVAQLQENAAVAAYETVKDSNADHATVDCVGQSTVGGSVTITDATVADVAADVNMKELNTTDASFVTVDVTSMETSVPDVANLVGLSENVEVSTTDVGQSDEGDAMVAVVDDNKIPSVHSHDDIVVNNEDVEISSTDVSFVTLDDSVNISTTNVANDNAGVQLEENGTATVVDDNVEATSKKTTDGKQNTVFTPIPVFNPKHSTSSARLDGKSSDIGDTYNESYMAVNKVVKTYTRVPNKSKPAVPAVNSFVSSAKDVQHVGFVDGTTLSTVVQPVCDQDQSGSTVLVDNLEVGAHGKIDLTTSSSKDSGSSTHSTMTSSISSPSTVTSTVQWTLVSRDMYVISPSAGSNTTGLFPKVVLSTLPSMNVQALRLPSTVPLSYRLPSRTVSNSSESSSSQHGGSVSAKRTSTLGTATLKNVSQSSQISKTSNKRCYNGLHSPHVSLKKFCKPPSQQKLSLADVSKCGGSQSAVPMAAPITSSSTPSSTTNSTPCKSKNIPDASVSKCLVAGNSSSAPDKPITRSPVHVSWSSGRTCPLSPFSTPFPVISSVVSLSDMKSLPTSAHSTCSAEADGHNSMDAAGSNKQPVVLLNDCCDMVEDESDTGIVVEDSDSSEILPGENGADVEILIQDFQDSARFRNVTLDAFPGVLKSASGSFKDDDFGVMRKWNDVSSKSNGNDICKFTDSDDDDNDSDIEVTYQSPRTSASSKQCFKSNKANVVSCPDCGKAFEKVESFVVHFKDEHVSKKFKCIYCNNFYGLKSELVVHMQQHLLFWQKSPGSGTRC